MTKNLFPSQTSIINYPAQRFFLSSKQNIKFISNWSLCSRDKIKHKIKCRYILFKGVSTITTTYLLSVSMTAGTMKSSVIPPQAVPDLCSCASLPVCPCAQMATPQTTSSSTGKEATRLWPEWHASSSPSFPSWTINWFPGMWSSPQVNSWKKK